MTIKDFCNIRQGWDITDETWHATRLEGVGGSDASTIQGINKYTSALQLYAEKTGAIPHEVVDNEAIRWGKRLERPVAEEYAERENVAVVNWPVMLQSKKYPWMLANLDFVIVKPSTVFEGTVEKIEPGVVTDWYDTKPPPYVEAILEIKTGGIGSHGSIHEWGTEEQPQLPKVYELQCRHYQIVTGILSAKLVGLLGGVGLAIRNVPFDQNYAEAIIDSERRFWNEHVVPRIPPEPDGSKSAEATIKTLYPVGEETNTFEGGSKLDLLWRDYLKAKIAADEADTERDALKNRIKALLGKSAYGMVHGKVICSFKNSKDGESFNEALFRRDNPRLYAKYVSPRPGSRALREVK